jgi:2-oxoisovalerate dehydrogenase E2 component (dihydrolipoyl transacylase)
VEVAGEDEAANEVVAPVQAVAATAVAPSAAVPAAGIVAPAASTGVAAPAAAVAPGAGGGRFSPAVLALAASHGVDLALVAGTGAGGRITRKDVTAFVAGRGNAAAAPVATPVAAVAAPAAVPTAAVAPPAAPTTLTPSAPLQALAPTAPAPQAELAFGDTSIPVNGMRRAIANKMVQSTTEIPHAWLMVEADVTNLVALRNKHKNAFKSQEGTSLTYLPFFIKAVVNAVKAFPLVNAQWDGDRIIVHKDVNVSLAVGTDDSVVTPVIQHADQRNIVGIAKEIDALATKVRTGKLRAGDLQGGTITVNNTGAFGSIMCMPIINHPQVAIITMESIVKRPVVVNDMIGIRSMVNICMSLDHRVLDGMIVGKFLQHVKHTLETIDPNMDLY